MSVAPFLVKTFDLVSDTENDPVVSWTPDGSSFVVWNPPEFSKFLLPKHFKHNNFSSFVRQLNTYGFKKIDPDRWEFANANFQRDCPDLMASIQRRKGQTKEQQPPSHALIASGQNVIEVGQYGGLVEEVEGLKRDKNVLMMELVHLRQQQQKSDSHVSAMRKRLEHTEKRLSEVIAFFSRVASNPAVLAQMVTAAQQSQAYLAGAEARRKKRRADGDTGDTDTSNGALIPYKPIDVATFFQNLLVSPLPDAPDVQHPEGMADALEAQFNGIDLAEGKPTLPPDGFTLHEHSTSSVEPGGDESNGEDYELDIQVPPELAGAIPSIGGIAASAACASAGATPAISSGNTEQPCVFDLAQLPPNGVADAGAASPGLFSGSIPLPESAGISLDEMDIPADLLLDGTIGDIFGKGSSLGELPDFKEENWSYIMDDEFGAPPPLSS